MGRFNAASHEVFEKIAMGRVGIKLRGLLPQTVRRASQKENNNYRTIDSF